MASKQGNSLKLKGPSIRVKENQKDSMWMGWTALKKVGGWKMARFLQAVAPLLLSRYAGCGARCLHP